VTVRASCLLALGAFAVAACSARGTSPPHARGPARFSGLHEVEAPAAARAGHVTAIVGVRLIDGRGGPPVEDAVVVVRGDKIVAAGPRATIPVPPDAERIDGAGGSLLPGLIDVHFHLEAPELPQTYLMHGITALRDPGEWQRTYDVVRHSGRPAPRLFLTGPHLDRQPVAHPESALPVATAAEAVAAVQRFADEGASCIKIYFRIPLEWFRPIAAAAHARGLPVTAHLELVDADQAVLAGLDGVEHVTSVGTAIAAPDDARAFKAAVTADNAARGPGRYALWDKIDLEHSPRVPAMLDVLVAHHTFFTPTLAVYERQPGDPDTGPRELHAFALMVQLPGWAARAGVAFVVGSHALVPHARPSR
jgi:hypothetical protein